MEKSSYSERERVREREREIDREREIEREMLPFTSGSTKCFLALSHLGK